MARFLGLVLGVVAGWLMSSPASAFEPVQCASFTAAMSNCQAEIASKASAGWTITTKCVPGGAEPNTYINWAGTNPNGVPGSYNIPYNCPGWNPCMGRSPVKMLVGSDKSICMGGCAYTAGQDKTTDTVRDGPWLAQLVGSTFEPTGAKCPADLPDTSAAESPRLCGGSSCHDTAAGKYCADSSSGQVCISDKPPPSGGCASSGDTTICAGNPPPMPPNPPIADPTTDIAGSDTYGHQEGSGAITNTTVNNYNNSGSGPNSGAVAGDSGNAPGSPNAPPGSPNNPGTGEGDPDKQGDQTKASGGGDCNTPPICEGNQAVCMTVRQTWLLRCSGGQDTSGAAGQDGNTDVPGLEGIGEGPGEGFIRTSDALSKLDTGGLVGGSSCPAFVLIDLEAYGVHMDSSSLPWCEILDKIGYMLMFVAAFISLRILSSK